MPHYKDGTPAKIGDVVVGPKDPTTKLVGVVHQIMTGSDTCNMLVGGATAIVEADGSRVVLPQPPANTFYCTCKEFAKVAVWLLCALGALGGALSPAWGQQSRLDRKMDGSTQYNIGRSAEPPTTDAEKLFLTIVTHDNYSSIEREKQFAGWFFSDPRLVKLKANTRWNWYTESNPHYKDRLRYKYGDALPMVNISRPDGETVLHVTAMSLPRTSGELADMADDAVNAKFSAPTYRSGGMPQTQIVEDCGPDCNPPKQPDGDDGQQMDPIHDVIPPRTNWLHVLAVLGGVFFVLAVMGGMAVVLAVVFWPRPSPPQQLIH
jgi:hypothetical protein